MKSIMCSWKTKIKFALLKISEFKRHLTLCIYKISVEKFTSLYKVLIFLYTYFLNNGKMSFLFMLLLKIIIDIYWKYRDILKHINLYM